MKAIRAGKKKSDTIDAPTIADLVRCNLLPACYVAPPRIACGAQYLRGSFSAQHTELSFRHIRTIN
jgi:hypothetical protein